MRAQEPAPRTSKDAWVYEYSYWRRDDGNVWWRRRIEGYGGAWCYFCSGAEWPTRLPALKGCHAARIPL